jgi:pyruvate dehydrogenase E2 component (dihydrolipoamide acetyltransferase)
MATEITMPKLSDTMTEGTLVSWKKSVGERVERGDIVAEVETDKAVMELEAFTSGILLETRAEPGEMVQVGSVIAVIGAEGEKVAPAEAKTAPPPEEPPDRGPTAAPSRPPEQTEVEAGASPTPSPTAADRGAPVKASPAVRRLAREKGIELESVRGTGPEGRVLKEDLESLTAPSERVEPPAAAPSTVPPGAPVQETEPPPAEAKPSKGPTEALSGPLSGMRAAIAATVAESWRTIPHFTVTVDIDMEATENLRNCLKEAGTSVSVTDVVIKATALALGAFPRLNATLTGDRVTVHPEIHMGVAVDVSDGLLIPVVRNCEVLSLRETALISRDVVSRARTGRLRQTEISGATFTISNLGMFGVTDFTALIPPGQAGILAVAAITDQPVVRKGHVMVSRLMKATLSADHRVVDGAYGAGFLHELKSFLENPVRLLV